MKMRIIFVLSLVSFATPFSVMAAENFDASRTHKGCERTGLKTFAHESTVRSATSSARQPAGSNSKALNSRSAR
jgi:hypothetical protein